MDHGDDSHDIPHPELEDVTQPLSEDGAQSEAPTLSVLKENEVWTMGMFIYICVCVCVCVDVHVGMLLSM